MHKIAVTAHKLRPLADEAIELLRSKGIIDAKKLTRGLERGNQKLVNIHDIKLERYPEISLNKSRSIHNYNTATKAYVPGGDRIELGSSTKFLSDYYPEYTKLPFIDKLNLARMQRALVKRHEIDETIAVKRNPLAASPKDHLIGGHMSPSVLQHEGFNLKYMDPSSKKVFLRGSGRNSYTTYLNIYGGIDSFIKDVYKRISYMKKPSSVRLNKKLLDRAIKDKRRFMWMPMNEVHTINYLNRKNPWGAYPERGSALKRTEQAAKKHNAYINRLEKQYT